MPEECQRGPPRAVPDHRALVLPKLVIAEPNELISNTPKIVLCSIGIPIPNNSLRLIVSLDEVLVVFRRAFVLQFRSTTLDSTLKPLNVLHRGIWQSWIDGCVSSRGYEDDGLVLR